MGAPRLISPSRALRDSRKLSRFRTQRLKPVFWALVVLRLVQLVIFVVCKPLTSAAVGSEVLAEAWRIVWA